MSNKSRILLIINLGILTLIFHYNFKKKIEKSEISKISRHSSVSRKMLRNDALDFELKTLTGDKIILSDVIGKKVIILNFFTTWCGPCKKEIPALSDFYEMNKDGLLLLGINVGEKEEIVREFVNDYAVSYPVSPDEEEDIAKMYKVGAYPTTVLIGADGKIWLYEVGEISNTDVVLEQVYRTNLELIKSGKGISKEDFLKAVEKPASQTEKKSALSVREKKIALQIYCPRGCGKNLIVCNCKLCKNIMKEIKRKMKSKIPDKEIAVQINKRYCSWK